MNPHTLNTTNLSHSVPFNSQILKTHNANTVSYPISSSRRVYNSLEEPSNRGFVGCNNRLPYFQRAQVVSHLRFNFGFGVSSDSELGSEKCGRLRNEPNGGGMVRVRCCGGSEGGDDGFYMRRAVELARNAIGCTSPNPMVGCVIVKHGEIVGEGFHPKAGQPHAEVFALKDAGDLAENATAYVNLEPCNHYGRTPPCTEALIEAKVKKVVVGMVDPNPIVASKGVNRLRDVGIEVIVGVEEDLCKKLNEAYIHRMLTGKPFITLRYTISIDGVILDQLGEGVTESGGYYSRLLQEYDAIIHSSSTLAKESFFWVSKEPKANQPLHIVVAKGPASPISIPNLASKAIVFTDTDSIEVSEAAQIGVEAVVTDGISLDAIIEYCKNQGSCSVLLDLRGKSDDLEEIVKVALDNKLVQKVVVEVLPFWAGNGANMPLALTNLKQRIGLKKFSAEMVGKSILLEGYF